MLNNNAVKHIREVNMVAALPAISAGVSVVQGVAGLAAKNTAASSQRQQLAIQQQQNMQASATVKQRLFVQQEQVEREYALNRIAAQAADQQQKFGLQAQGLLASFETQRQQANIEQQSLRTSQDSLQAVDALARQAASNKTGASTQRQQSLKQEASTADELSGGEQQVQKQISDTERQMLIRQASQDNRSSSSVLRDEAERVRMLANTLSVGLDMDRAQVEAALQGANERDITTMMEQLSAGDTEFNQQRVAANLQLARQQSANQSQTLQFNDGQQQQALSMNRQQQDINARMADNNRTSLETTQRADYMLQQESNADTANSVNASLQQQQRSAKGASLLDYLGTGLTGYNAVAPLFKKEKEQVPEYKKLGGPNAYMPQQGPNAYMPPQYGNKSGEYTSQTGAA
jgi:hypothetical protein